MGWFNRLKQITISPLQAAWQVPGLAVDLAFSPWNDDEDYNGFLHTIQARTMSRLGSAINEGIGPEGFGGQVIGALPEPVRDAGRSVTEPVLGGVAAAYKQGVSRPLSTLMTVASFASEDSQAGDWGVFFKGDEWKKAWKISQSRTPGQAIYLALTTKNIEDPAEVARQQGTDGYKIASGLMDAVISWELDPTTVAGKAVKGYRVGTNMINAKTVDGYLASKKYTEVSDYIDSVKANAKRVPVAGESKLVDDAAKAAAQAKAEAMGAKFIDTTQQVDEFAKNRFLGPAGEQAALDEAAGKVRHRLFPNHPDGDQISYYLVNAETKAERDLIIRAMAGQGNAVEELAKSNAALANRINSLDSQIRLVDANASDFVRDQFKFDFENMTPEKYKGLVAERDLLESQYRWNERIARPLSSEEVAAFKSEGLNPADFVSKDAGSLVGTLKEAPKMTFGGAIRENVGASDFYQSSKWMRPVAVFTRNNPPNLLALDQAGADGKLSRWLRQSKVFDELEVSRARGEFARLDNSARDLMVQRLQEQAYRRIAEANGLDVKELKGVLKESAESSRRVRSFIEQSRAYATDNADVLNFVDQNGVIHELRTPLLASQTANITPLVDWRAVHSSLNWYGDFARRNPGLAKAMSTIPEVADSVMSVWKTASLLRPGWTLRVGIDEQLRRISQIGSMADMLEYASTTKQGLVNWLARAGGAEGLNVEAKGLRSGIIGGALAGGAAAGPVGAVAGAAAGGGLLKAIDNIESTGFKGLNIDGFSATGAFGEKYDLDNFIRKQASSAQGMQSFVDEVYEKHLANTRGTGQWATLSGADTGWGKAWENAVNNQLGQDVLARKLLAGESVNDVAKWLHGTQEGRMYAKEIPLRGAGILDRSGLAFAEDWVDRVNQQIKHLTLDDPDIKQAALNQEARAKLVDNILKPADGVLDVGTRPPVHGEVLTQTLGKHPVQQMLHNFVEKSFKYLGTMPSDELARNTTFATIYGKEMERLVKNSVTQNGFKLAESDIKAMEGVARKHALAEMKNLMFDLGERSEFSTMVRNIIPFFNAQQEVLTRWAGIAIDNPSVARRAQMAYQEMDKLMFSSEDANGNKVIQFRIPDWASSIVGQGIFKSAVDDQGYVAFNKKSLNMITGGIGFGPYVQVVATGVANQNPGIEDTLKFIMPFGPATSVVDPFLPATVKRAMAITSGEDSRAYATAQASILLTKLTKMKTGESPRLDLEDAATRDKFLADVKSETDAYFRLRTFVSAVSPVAVSFSSPYQPYIDEYRRLKREDPQNADRRFLTEHGEDFYALTQSFTKLNDGVPATLPGLKARDKYKTLIEANPELGSLIIGSEGGGEAVKFSRAMYDRQLESPVSPGSDTKQRSRYTTQELIDNPEIRLGWEKYTKAMDMIDAARISRGVPSLQAKGAEDLAQARQAILLSIAKDHPAWFEEYSKRDDANNARKIAGMKQIVRNQQLMGRPDIQGLSEYLNVRDAIMGTLTVRKAQGGSGDLWANSNADLSAVFEAIVGSLKEKNLSFSNLYNRWLDRDHLTIDLASQVMAA